MAEHAPLGFSSSARWMSCAASYQEGLKAPKFEGNQFTRQGTAAHELAEKVLRELLTDGCRPADLVEYMMPEEGEQFPDFLDADDLRAVAVYVNLVLDIADEGHDIYLEQRVQLGDESLELFGTADCVAVSKKKEAVLVMDYKHGRGVTVSAEGNRQLLSYLAAVLDSDDIDLTGVKHYVVGIVQPRGQGQAIQTCPVSFEEIWNHAQTMLEARKQARGPSPSFAMGDWCRWCPALAQCPHVLAQVEQATTLDLGQTEKLEEALELVEVAEQWCKHVRGTAHEHLEQGGVLAGWGLYPKRAQRKWLDPEDALQAMLNAGLRRDAVVEEKVISVAKAAKLLPLADWELINEYCVVAQSSGTTLGREDPKREAIGGREDRMRQAQELLSNVGGARMAAREQETADALNSIK